MDQIEQAISTIKNEYINASSIEDIVEILKRTIMILDDMNKNNKITEKEQFDIMIQDILNLTSKKKSTLYLVKNVVTEKLSKEIKKRYDITEEDIKTMKELYNHNDSDNILSVEEIAKRINEMSQEDFETFIELEKGRINEKTICKAVQNELIESKERAVYIRIGFQQTFTSLEVKKVEGLVSKINKKVSTQNVLKGTGIKMRLSAELRDIGIYSHLEQLNKWTKTKGADLIFDSTCDKYETLMNTVSGKKRLMYIVETNDNNVFGTFNGMSLNNYGDKITNDTKHFMFSIINPSKTEPLMFSMKLKVIDSLCIDSKDGKIITSLGCCTLVADTDDDNPNVAGTIDGHFGEYYKDKKGYGAKIFDGKVNPQVFNVKKLLVLEMK
ncbi:hypothetical protein EHI8A_043930 [Entamoeba histolytica HM-1:IMSS-B]|uniref:TLDc domain-containing protein n=6 Tax=Entamoeba histolytica TaxID=5759 RepID=C4M8F9_ENTH1|nr:hypothetical protein EHI_036570 [Entamoeba histolytica HM-1:IMSS]EMD44249.1 Hypothetical protein EHI5A_049620 [Entamoeba histolytica KU27]EMH73218.1 hypothetical protein EHI8A_043930 [Entamoeba histolytica HM-1:IMSS-B]EMS16268.1 hypothetical protein KM1_057530 [Entamoeba histolytica HM-3:IMSS]ENY60857.1 hypothetical protein EHI7A_028780 [Entamoeba histolytica HM-1:IMSS-A]GAT97883.1 hypothetical protein CL6EHI_036570 [Entamoeba histolytica]|eukprot:XP_651567.2 hypothetical protein EHI_036570 [Entamoeba histolytica HM-1:IMSS]